MPSCQVQAHPVRGPWPPAPGVEGALLGVRTAALRQPSPWRGVGGRHRAHGKWAMPEAGRPCFAIFPDVPVGTGGCGDHVLYTP